MDVILPGSNSLNKKPTPLQGFEIPLEIFLILHHAPKLGFTVKNIQDVLKDLHGDRIRRPRVQQICDAMAERRRIVKSMETHPKTGQLVSSYTIGEDPAVLIGHPLFRIVQTLVDIEI